VAIFLFAVGNALQFEAAAAVAEHLPGKALALNMASSQVTSLDVIDMAMHRVRPSLTSARSIRRAVLRWSGRPSSSVLVIPQDVGLLYRVAVAAARSRLKSVALMPDGAVSAERIAPRPKYLGISAALDAIATRFDLVAGSNGLMGGSKPDLCLSWGPGWNGVWHARGIENVINAGSPRFDRLSMNVGPPPSTERVLLASQPLWTPNMGGWETARRWYSWLEVLANQAPLGALRIRLHPFEKQTLTRKSLGTATCRSLSNHSLEQDLHWASSVVSATSTILVEAAASGRKVASVQPFPAVHEAAVGYPFLTDPRLPQWKPGSFPEWPAILALLATSEPHYESFGRDYLANRDRSSTLIAQRLRELAERGD
jgi:hypothetical protein